MTWLNEPLRVFYEVAEHHNFTHAAKRLHITQSAVSQQIRSLEDDLGTVLIDRSNRRAIRLTQAGQIVHDHAKRILRIEEEMRLRVEDSVNVARGTLVIGASYTIGEYILPAVIAEFWDLCPEIEHKIEIHNTPAIVQGIMDRKIDVGLVESTVHEQAQSFHTEEVAEDKLVLIVPMRHALAAKRSVRLADVADETWIVREIGSGTREYTDGVFATCGIHPKRMMAFSSTQGIKEAVRAGLGVALISSWALLGEMAVRSVQVVHLQDIDLSRPISLVSQPQFVESRAARVFADFVRTRFAGLGSDLRR